MGRIRRFAPGARQLRLLDLLVLVALTALPMMVIATAMRAKLSPEARLAIVAVALAAPVVVGLLWLLTEPGVFRSRWGEGPASVLYVVLTLAGILAVIVLYFVHPGAALLIGVEVLGLLAYLLSWL